MKRITFLFGLPTACLLFFSSCGGNEEEKIDKVIQNKMDSSNIAIGVSGRVFIIPSPIQTEMLIQKSGATYNKNMLNETNKVNSYSTKFQKCLNLGIYGADLGYTTLYDQTQDAITYFKVTNTLANDLGLTSAFDKKLVERFQKNLGNKDSMLVMVSAAYRASNDFLKHNERNEEAALIIAGGWIETLHFAINVMKTKGNEDVKRRIAEQKNTLNNLISLLSAYQGNEEYAELLQKLNDLKTEYDNVQYKYIFKQSVTDEANKITTITSESEIIITPETIQSIGEKIASIREMIIA
jgi:murein L,D-transpeptidase YcbB/YkuD